ncbi:MAG: formylglycine-generating enzyme family protein [Elusimicrobia bacterium]|nr:formylglycine-generating enzyme family protein [Elusimicrobiota bacterium]
MNLITALLFLAMPLRAGNVEWVSVPGGKFEMGTNENSGIFRDAKPVHQVAIKAFQMSKTLVTVEQYAECVRMGACTEPAAGAYCNWGKPDRLNHPVNCVDWEQAGRFAAFKGARLPTEAEWEYAATGGGRNQKYPWGDAPANCELAVMRGSGGSPGCDGSGTMPVCSRPKGNAQFASGGELCDAVGNVWQWVQDHYKTSYAGAPTDGGAVVDIGPSRVLRGGAFVYEQPDYLRADFRGSTMSFLRSNTVGFRVAR